MATQSVPCLDISRIVAGCPSDEDVSALGSACREFGFFNVVNHGIPKEVISRFDAAVKRFFRREDKEAFARTRENSRGYSATELTKRTRDVKELLDYGHVPRRDLPLDHPENRVMDGYNQVPDDDQDFKEAVDAYYEDCAKVCACLLRCTARSLGLDLNELDEHFREHTSYLRMNFYPPLPRDATRFEDSSADLDRVRGDCGGDDPDKPLGELDGPRLGVNRHFDAGALTLLRQDDDVRALQMNYQAHDKSQPPRWINVDPVPGGLTVNCGDMLQVLSNGEIKAAEHRVLASPPGTVRYSAPFFFNPSYEAVMRPHHRKGEIPNYTPFTYGYFRKRRFLGDFEDEGLPEIQIEDFRLHHKQEGLFEEK